MRSPTTTSLATVLLLLGGTHAQSESSEAGLTDPAQECAPYSYSPVASALAAFPSIWTPVSALVASDTEGQAKFKAISGSIPNIAPKGTLGVPDTNVTTNYSTSDPDCWWTKFQCVTPKLSNLQPDIANVPEPRTLGYGFDDGPNCTHNAFYNFLQSKNQKATMFYIGSNVFDWPLQAQRAVTDGHEICVHTWSHRSMTAFNNEQAFGELWYTMQAIKLVTGYTPTCWRPPLGDVDDRIRFIAQQLNLTTILWKTDSFDWEVQAGTATTQQVQANYDTLVNNVKSGMYDSGGTIMLTHELNNYTMQTAMDNYANLSSAFSHMVPIAVALNKTHPYVETNFTMPDFASYTSGNVNSSTNSSSGASNGGGGSAAVALHPPALGSGVALVLALVAAAATLL